MFEKFSQFLQRGAPLNEQYKQFVEMLKIDHKLFSEVIDGFRGIVPLDELEDDVYQTDLKINKLERNIRKSLVTHLSISPERDVAGCLVLMSIVKDAERVGDFCKNLYEAAEFVKKPCSELFYCDKITRYTNFVDETFRSTIEAFQKEDDVLAAEILQDEIKWNRRFDQFIEELVESELPTREAVCTTLIARSLKRLQAHLSNIASSVVLPVHQIDHRPKDMK
jgi:phosphate uptake regulator